ncbi:MAG: hypothetical protein PUP91_19355 [Rhizonema sp. PD37]|nr:hypothetical protein [Rhizonema sp. PD37]
MKTPVSQIQYLPKKHFIEVWLLIENRQFHFPFSRKVDKFANYHWQIITHKRSFGELLRFNKHIFYEVMNLLWMFSQDESIKLPANVGDFGTSEQTLRFKKPFEFEFEIEM